MAIDKANIFKLEKEELQKYENNEFEDCMPGAKEFAEELKSHILTKETPYILLLEDNFGMGKTHFSTRFCNYLRNKDINAIYFSAWENDYIENPFEAFSKEILLYINENDKLKSNAKKIATSICELIYNSAKATSISIGQPGMALGIDNEKVIDAATKFLNNFIKEKDSIQKFKKTIKDFVKTLSNQKLVIIVDELDRCRPNYAMKTLEIIKHLFDIEGLFIIVPTNMASLNNAVKSLYGIDVEQNNYIENYCNKFFTNRFNLFNPDYSNLVNNYINANSFNKLIQKNKMTLKDKYNSVVILQEKLAKFGRCFKLTLREMCNVCNQAKYFCENYNGKIYSEYLAYSLCQKSTRLKNFVCNIQEKHPFSPGAKSKILRFIIPQEVYTLSRTSHESDFYKSYPIFRNLIFNSYEDFNKFYDSIPRNENGEFILLKYYRQDINIGTHYAYDYDLGSLATYIINKKKEIDEYRQLWNSDDDDEKVKADYDNFANCECSIFGKTCEE